MNALPELRNLAGEALMVLLQLAAALLQVREGNVPKAAQELTAVVRSEPAGRPARRCVEDALYWRARLAGTQDEREARAAAAKDYVELIRRLPEGRRRREAKLRLAELSEPGRYLSPDEATEASARNLRRIGRALHDYAADHGGRLPGALEDLIGDYVSDETVLVRPGGRARGGGRAYAYLPDIPAELNVTRTGSGAKVALDGGVPVVVREPVAMPESGAPGRSRRLILRLDGEVRSVQESRKGGAAPRPAE